MNEEPETPPKWTKVKFFRPEVSSTPQSEAEEQCLRLANKLVSNLSDVTCFRLLRTGSTLDLSVQLAHGVEADKRPERTQSVLEVMWKFGRDAGIEKGISIEPPDPGEPTDAFRLRFVKTDERDALDLLKTTLKMANRTLGKKTKEPAPAINRACGREV